MAEYLLTSSLDPIAKGQEFDKDQPLPRHVTVHQWFSLATHRPLLNALQNYMTTVSPFEVTGGEEALYGPDNDIPVRLLSKIGRLAAMHTALTEKITFYGGEIKNPEWAGEGYSPHITYVDGQALGRGETAQLRTVELISRQNRVKRVEAVLGMSAR